MSGSSQPIEAGSKKMSHWVQLFSGLVRISHTVFALPFALGSMLVAAKGLPPADVLGPILLCMFSARNSAMAYNRLVDADVDARNPRTAMRHIPAGLLGRKPVLWFLIANGVLFVLGAWLLNGLTLALAVPVWLLLLSYSWWKRFSWLCHWYLGLVIGLSPLGAWVAVTGSLAVFPAMLGAVLLFWMAGFDIIYATQDEAFDRSQGLHSVPARFGRATALAIAKVNHIIMVILWLVLGWHFALGTVWWWVSGALVAVLLYVHLARRSDDLDGMNRDFFLANAAVSLLLLAGLATSPQVLL